MAVKLSKSGRIGELVLVVSLAVAWQKTGEQLAIRIA